MALPILSELNQELTRLFVAGSRLCVGDPRLKKYIGPLTKFGEKAPVFLKLTIMLEELLDAEPAESARKLLETESFLLSILATQGETVSNDTQDSERKPQTSDTQDSNNKPQTSNTQDSERKPQICEQEIAAGTRYIDIASMKTFPYSTIAPVLEVLRNSGGGRMQILNTALERDAFKDPRLTQPIADALADNSSDVTNFLITEVIPVVGSTIVPYLLEAFNTDGDASDGRRLRALYKLMGNSILSLAEDSFDRGSIPVKVEAAGILADFPSCETQLMGGLSGKKDVREATMKALIRMNSHTGIDKILTLMEKSEAVATVTYGYSPYLVERLLEIAHKRSGEISYNSITPDNLKLFAESLELLQYKHSEETAKFLQDLLSGNKLDNLKNPLPKRNEKMVDTVLDILYHTGYGNEFIWEMFRKTQQGLLGKLFGGKKEVPVMLPVYAFTIGARRLDPETFYDTFFKTQLYQDIVKINNTLFAETFLGNSQLPFSSRIAGYFLKNDDLVLAVRTVDPDDNEILNALADRLNDNLNNNVYKYVNDLIIERLGEAKYKHFAELYKLYCEKGSGSTALRESLARFLPK